MLFLGTSTNPGNAQWLDTSIIGGGGGRMVFAWSPGADDDPDNGIYGTFETAHAAALASAAIYQLADIMAIEGPDSGSDGWVVPEDTTFDMTGIALTSSQTYSGYDAVANITIVTSEGTVFTNFLRGCFNVDLRHTGSSPLQTFDTSTPINTQLYLGEFCTISTSDAPVISTDEEVFIRINMGQFSIVGGVEDTNHVIVFGDAGNSGINIQGNVGSNVRIGTLAGDGAASYTKNTVSSQIGTQSDCGDLTIGQTDADHATAADTADLADEAETLANDYQIFVQPAQSGSGGSQTLTITAYKWGSGFATPVTNARTFLVKAVLNSGGPYAAASGATFSAATQGSILTSGVGYAWATTNSSGVFACTLSGSSEGVRVYCEAAPYTDGGTQSDYALIVLSATTTFTFP